MSHGGFGVEISLVGHEICSYNEGITNKDISFQLVRLTFSFEKGQRVGMVWFYFWLQFGGPLTQCDRDDFHSVLVILGV